MNASGCVRASLVVLREWAGPAAAYAAGAASVTDERAMLVFVPWGVLLAEDAFVAYERMLRGYGDSVVAYAPVRGNGCSRLPVVAVEAFQISEEVNETGSKTQERGSDSKKREVQNGGAEVVARRPREGQRVNGIAGHIGR